MFLSCLAKLVPAGESCQRRCAHRTSYFELGARLDAYLGNASHRCVTSSVIVCDKGVPNAGRRDPG
jgi:hypothetical protein